MRLAVLALAGALVATALPAQTSAPVPPTPRATPADRERSQPRLPPAEVALHVNGRPEYVVAGPIRSAEAARLQLEAAGARLLTFRDLPALDRRVMVFDFGATLALDAAQERLRRAVPDQRAEFNHLYRYADGPRLYAPALVRGGVAGSCGAAVFRRIGLIDGPVDPDHPALRGARLRVTSSLVPGQRPAGPDHGTAVAALIAGVDATGALSGFAPGAEVFAVGAFAEERGGVAADVDRIAGALDWLLRAEVRLVNLSFAGPSNGVLDDLIRQAAARGAVLVAAAGNGGRTLAAAPAAHPDVIAVTAVDAGLRLYRSANRGAHIEFAAPGVDLYVARPGGGGYASGTSYAAPIVTALAARLAPGPVDQVRRGLRAQARDLGPSGRDAEFGWGLPQLPGC